MIPEKRTWTISSGSLCPVWRQNGCFMVMICSLLLVGRLCLMHSTVGCEMTVMLFSPMLAGSRYWVYWYSTVVGWGCVVVFTVKLWKGQQAPNSSHATVHNILVNRQLALHHFCMLMGFFRSYIVYAMTTKAYTKSCAMPLLCNTKNNTRIAGHGFFFGSTFSSNDNEGLGEKLCNATFLYY
jgi:hypothetical protein